MHVCVAHVSKTNLFLLAYMVAVAYAYTQLSKSAGEFFATACVLFYECALYDLFQPDLLALFPKSAGELYGALCM